MGIASAIIGGAVIGGLSTAYGADRASDANSAAARSAADATVRSTELQIAEMRRQFDEQLRLLQPLIDNQYGAGSAFAQLLGFDSVDENGRVSSSLFSDTGAFVDPNLNPTALGAGSAADTEYGQQAFGNVLAGASPEEDLAIRRAAETQLYAGLDADTAVQQARGRQNAGDIGSDPYLSNVFDTRTADGGYLDYIEGNRLAAPTMAEDERFRFAQDTAIVGDTFEASPGYEFAVEEMQRQVDRKNSAGGNYGGRALMEAQRRAQGLANQDYYNWVAARGADLGRQDMAAAAYQNRQAIDTGRGDRAYEFGEYQEQFDLTRQDEAMRNYLARVGIDIGREDAAVYDARRREELDLARGDAALDNYFGRRAGDLARQDQSILTNMGYRQYDLARQDQGYYNYLNSLYGAAGLGTGVQQAVGASGAAGAGVANAYAGQGAQLSNIFQNAGRTAGNIAMTEAAGYNNVAQGSISNWLLMNYLNG